MSYHAYSTDRILANMVLYHRAKSIVIDPLTLSGLQFLLDADSTAGMTLGGTGGDEISQYIERSPNGYTGSQATQAARPKRIASVLDGKGVIRFDGSNDWLGFGDILDVGTANWTYISIFKRNGYSGTYPPGPFSKGSGSNTAGEWGMYHLSADVINLFFNATNGSNVGFNPTVPYTVFNVLEETINRGAQKIGASVNKGTFQYAAGSLPGTNYNTIVPFVLGSGYLASTGATSPSLFWPGDIAYMAFFNRLLTETERQGVYNFLKMRYPSLNFSFA